MKAYNHLFESLDLFEDFLDGIELDRNKRVLLRIHSSIHTMEMMNDLATELKEILPQAVMIGCSTSKVIFEGKLVSSACLISITEFCDCEMRLGMFPCVMGDGEERDGEDLSREVSEKLVKGDRGMMLAFFPLSYYKTARFVEEMDAANPGLKMIGGVSYVADAAHFEVENYAYVLADTQASASDMAAVMLVSPQLSIYENVICGVENLGRSYEVTKAHEHYLDEIEGKSGAEWYAEMLGKEELDKDPSLAGIFPLVQENTGIAYSVVYEPYNILPEPWKSTKKDRVNLYSGITEGERFYLGYFDPKKIVDQMNTVYQELSQAPVEVLFAYDCLARMWMLHDCAEWEIGQFRTTNISGALLGGEISNINGQNRYANSTFVVAGISEDPNARILLKGKALHNVSALQHENVQMINYLLTMGNKQLNKQLDEQQNKMKKAMFYHEVFGLANQSKYLYDREKKNLDKIAVFSLKNERMLKLFMGRGALQNKLKKLYKAAGEKMTGKGFYPYSYGEYSLLIAAEDSVEDEKFKKMMKDVFEKLNGNSCNEFVLSYECALVLHEEEPVQKAEAMLQYGIKYKQPFVIYGEMPEKVLGIKDEMHMLQILKDALAQDRIIPYFQGIYDNRQGCINMYEALIRILDDQGNMYYPNQFLSIAKEADLYETLSVVMVKKVMEMFLNKNVTVTINLNVRDIYDRDMIKMIFKYLKEEKHPENFVFELVESEEVKDYSYIKQFADSIHEYGARIAIDDFGSGFSNLMHIIRIDADIIKIDGDIIKGVCTDEKCREFLEMINDWCHHKNKEIVAEFVENKDIQKAVRDIGVTHSQGYYYAKPEPWENK